jgi:dTDP-4-dehydrorhamnose reductase
MLNILVTGANGQLGSSLKSLAPNYPNFTFYFTDKNELDITKIRKIEEFISKNKIQLIINCAAYTNVDKAEDEFPLANEINHLAVENLGVVSKDNNIRLIHISTDYVFDGTLEKPYVETDKTNPTNNYGITKLKGEEALLKLNPENSIIIRTSWLYSLYGNNFVKTMMRLGKEKETINVVSDQIGSPTNASDLAKAILQIIPLIESKRVEIYHYSNSGVCSWFQFAKEIMRISKSDCKVEPILSKDYNSKAPRPNFSILNTEKIQNTFNVEVPQWKTSLRNYIQ